MTKWHSLGRSSSFDAKPTKLETVAKRPEARHRRGWSSVVSGGAIIDDSGPCICTQLRMSPAQPSWPAARHHHHHGQQLQLISALPPSASSPSDRLLPRTWPGSSFTNQLSQRGQQSEATKKPSPAQQRTTTNHNPLCPSLLDRLPRHRSALQLRSGYSKQLHVRCNNCAARPLYVGSRKRSCRPACPLLRGFIGPEPALSSVGILSRPRIRLTQ